MLDPVLFLDQDSKDQLNPINPLEFMSSKNSVFPTISVLPGFHFILFVFSYLITAVSQRLKTSTASPGDLGSAM